MIEEVAVGLETDILKVESGMTRVFAVDLNSEALKVAAEALGIAAGIKVVVATFAMQRLRITAGQRRPFDDNGGQPQWLHDLVLELQQRIISVPIVVLDCLGHRGETEQLSARRALSMGEHENGIIKQGRNRLPSRLVEELPPLGVGERSAESGKGIVATKEAKGYQLREGRKSRHAREITE